jgi:uncharacterized membrane protein YwaF
MSAYSSILLVHSWLRWLVLVALVAGSAAALHGWLAARPLGAADRRLSLAAVIAVDSQLVLGLLLYFWLSPITQLAFSDAKAAMKQSALRFFFVEHLALMLLAVVVLHVGRVRARKKADDRGKHRTTALTLVFALLLVLAGIPWPGLGYGRPLFR